MKNWGGLFDNGKSLKCCIPRYTYLSMFEAPDWFYRLLGFDVIDQAPAKGEVGSQSEYDVYINGRNSRIHVRINAVKMKRDCASFCMWFRLI